MANTLETERQVERFPVPDIYAKMIPENEQTQTAPKNLARFVKDYHINIFYSVQDESYIADIPDLQCCSAFGETPEEALKQVEIAKAAWLEAARDSRKPIPEPRYRPVAYEV